MKGFTLERVLAQIIATGKLTFSPLELLQRLFDTDNSLADGAFEDSVHCDDALHPAASVAGSPSCTRAEGRLACASPRR